METPKEKAIELYKKYELVLNIRDMRAGSNPFVKECALVTIDEIIKSTPLEPAELDWDGVEDYWKEVKTEIEKL